MSTEETNVIKEKLHRPRILAGREMIVTDYKEVTAGNIVDFITSIETAHDRNAADIDYLYKYYRGLQPVMYRNKPVRPEIKNLVVENRANEIVSFKTGYLMGEPVSYIARTDKDSIVKNIDKLNEFVFNEDKASHDKELADWMHIGGIGYRLCLPDENYTDDSNATPDDSPFELTVLDPRFTCVVHRNDLAHSVIAGITIVPGVNGGEKTYYIYTDEKFYTVVGSRVVNTEENGIGMVPIIEYPANTARLGAFEVVLPLLDAINNVDSNRMDSVEQVVQALLLFHNVDISDEGFDKMREKGAIKFKDIDPQLKAEISYITASINQNETQTLVDHLYETVLTICGMPNRNGGTSTSDTGSAVIMRDGWSAAEARAKDTELMFKKAEKRAIKVMLKICAALSGFELKLSDIDIRFTRRNYENIQGKAQVLISMLNCDKIPPRLAFEQCNMFVDVENAYQQYLEYEEQRKEEVLNGNQPNNGGNGPEDGTRDNQNIAQGQYGGSEEA